MKQITPHEFEKAIRANPAWATTLTEPVEIVGRVGLFDSPITHLSPLLHFLANATFQQCSLEVAEGTFHGSVSFRESRIVKIGNLTLTSPGSMADFYGCKDLKIAEGAFPGYVDFTRSGIERIDNLIISEPDHLGEAVNFSFCSRLEIATGNYPGGVDFSDSGIRAVRKLTATNAKFEECVNLEDVPPDFLDLPNMHFGPETLTRLREIEARRAQARKALKPGSIIEL